MTADASARGRASRAKGNSFEAELAKYLRQWWPSACRAVRTGSSAAADPGDIANVPFIVSAKNVAASTSSKPSVWRGWWAEVDAMLDGDASALGFIVEKRHGQGDVAEAWAHLRLPDLVGLVRGYRGDATSVDAPVRIRLGALVDLLVSAGYARRMSA